MGLLDVKRENRFDLVDQIFKYYLLSNPNRSEGWFGVTYDVLHDKSLVELVALRDVLKKNEKQKQI